VPADWNEMKTDMQQKFRDVDLDELRVKLDAVRQEPKQRVQLYFDQLDKLFRRGKFKDDEQRGRFLAHLRPEIRKLCMVRTYGNP